MQREKNIIRYSIISSRTCTHTYAIQPSSEESALGRIHTCLCLLPLIQFSSLKCYCGKGGRRPAPISYSPPHSVMHFYSCGFSLSCFAECTLYHILSSFPCHPPLIFPPFSIFSLAFPRSFLYCSPDVFLFSSSSSLFNSLCANICKIISIFLC